MQLGIGQQVRLGADGGFERGDDLLTLPVQRRVGDLCELLGEVVEQHAAAAGKRRHRRIVTHGTERFLAGVGHRREQELQILFGVAEGALTALDGLAGVADVLAAGQVAHFNGVAFHPLAVRVLGSEVPLDLFIGNDAAFGGVGPRTSRRAQDDPWTRCVPARSPAERRPRRPERCSRHR